MAQHADPHTLSRPTIELDRQCTTANRAWSRSRTHRYPPCMTICMVFITASVTSARVTTDPLSNDREAARMPMAAKAKHPPAAKPSSAARSAVRHT